MKFQVLWLGLALVACKADWSSDEKSRIKQDCFLTAEKYGFDDPEKHCNCVLDKIMERYPNPNEFENMEMGEFGSIVMECQGIEPGAREIWPKKTQMAFLDSCQSMAKKQGKDSSGPYCDCVLQKLMERYPTNDDLGNLNPTTMTEISKGCEEEMTSKP